MSCWSRNPEWFDTWAELWLHCVAGYSLRWIEYKMFDEDMMPWEIIEWLMPYTYYNIAQEANREYWENQMVKHEYVRDYLQDR